MKQFLTPYFWFSLQGDLSVVSRSVLIGLTVLFAGVFIYLKLTQSTWKKTLLRMVYEKSLSFLLVNSLLGAYLWFVTDQVIPVLSARFWFLLWFVEMASWVNAIYKEYTKWPDKKRQIAANKEIKKYIP